MCPKLKFSFFFCAEKSWCQTMEFFISYIVLYFAWQRHSRVNYFRSTLFANETKIEMQIENTETIASVRTSEYGMWCKTKSMHKHETFIRIQTINDSALEIFSNSFVLICICCLIWKPQNKRQRKRERGREKEREKERKRKKITLSHITTIRLPKLTSNWTPIKSDIILFSQF